MSERALSKYEQYPYYLTAGVTVTDERVVVYLRASGFNDDELTSIRVALDEAFDNTLDSELTGTPEKIAVEIPLEIDNKGNIQ